MHDYGTDAPLLTKQDWRIANQQAQVTVHLDVGLVVARHMRRLPIGARLFVRPHATNRGSAFV